MWIPIVTATLIVSIIGLLIGIVLGIANDKFKINVDEKELQIRELLPGNNCGGCGFASCDAVAKEIANENAPITVCPVGGKALIENLAVLLGQEVGEVERKVAFVSCGGDCEVAKRKYTYHGDMDCKFAKTAPGNSAKVCEVGCLGFGSCKKACEYDAIRIERGIAIVDPTLCVACGVCIRTCPNELISFVSENTPVIARCSSHDKGKTVKEACQVGCIACSLCVRACENGAIVMKDNLPSFDYTKCTDCGACVAKCPTKCINRVMETT